ncbi:MAG: SDR family oxidoreductase [Gemmatimonadales bacterium]
MSPTPGPLAIVSGASRGIGLAVATTLAGQGMRVARLARTLTAGTHGSFLDYPLDLTDAAAVQATGRRILAEAGTPAVVVNNAGVFDRMPFAESKVEELARQLKVNLVGAFALTQAFLPAMLEANDGVVITIGSIADLVGFPGNTIYSASKFGLRGLHETLAAEFRGTGLRFTLVSPGPTDTPIWEGVGGPIRPRNEMLTAQDVADAVLFVATRPRRVTIDVLRLMPS